MNTFGFTIVTVTLFVAGFGGTYYAVGKPGLMVASGPADCDARTQECRARLRAQGERAFGRGDVATGDAAFGRAAVAGDVRAAFELAWHHEEAYRKVAGKTLEAGTAPVEESQPGIAGLPKGAAFLDLTKRYEEVPPGPARALADRSLAFLWYGYAANGGFGPAMNNLGAMYQFGLMGARDRIQAHSWYRRAASAQNPVGKLNERILDIRYGAECDFDPSLVFAGGLTAPPIDLEDDVVLRTRFRGRTVPSGVRGMFKAQNLAVSKPPEEMGVLDVMQIAAAARAFDFTDLKQDWDDAPEVEAMRGKQRDCSEKRSASGAAVDHDKMRKLRSMQDSIDRRSAELMRRRY